MNEFLDSITDAVSSLVLFSEGSTKDNTMLTNIGPGATAVASSTQLLVEIGAEVQDKFVTPELQQKTLEGLSGIRAAAAEIVAVAPILQRNSNDKPARRRLLNSAKGILNCTVIVLQMVDIYECLKLIKFTKEVIIRLRTFLNVMVLSEYSLLSQELNQDLIDLEGLVIDRVKFTSESVLKGRLEVAFATAKNGMTSLFNMLYTALTSYTDESAGYEFQRVAAEVEQALFEIIVVAKLLCKSLFIALNLNFDLLYIEGKVANIEDASEDSVMNKLQAGLEDDSIDDIRSMMLNLMNAVNAGNREQVEILLNQLKNKHGTASADVASALALEDILLALEAPGNEQNASDLIEYSLKNLDAVSNNAITGKSNISDSLGDEATKRLATLNMDGEMEDMRSLLNQLLTAIETKNHSVTNEILRKLEGNPAFASVLEAARDAIKNPAALSKLKKAIDATFAADEISKRREALSDDSLVDEIGNLLVTLITAVHNGDKAAVQQTLNQLQQRCNRLPKALLSSLPLEDIAAAARMALDGNMDSLGALDFLVKSTVERLKSNVDDSLEDRHMRKKLATDIEDGLSDVGGLLSDLLRHAQNKNKAGVEEVLNKLRQRPVGSIDVEDLSSVARKALNDSLSLNELSNWITSTKAKQAGLNEFNRDHAGRKQISQLDDMSLDDISSLLSNMLAAVEKGNTTAVKNYAEKLQQNRGRIPEELRNAIPIDEILRESNMLLSTPKSSHSKKNLTQLLDSAMGALEFATLCDEDITEAPAKQQQELEQPTLSKTIVSESRNKVKDLHNSLNQLLQAIQAGDAPKGAEITKTVVTGLSQAFPELGQTITTKSGNQEALNVAQKLKGLAPNLVVNVKAAIQNPKVGIQNLHASVNDVRKTLDQFLGVVDSIVAGDTKRMKKQLANTSQALNTELNHLKDLVKTGSLSEINNSLTNLEQLIKKNRSLLSALAQQIEDPVGKKKIDELCDSLAPLSMNLGKIARDAISQPNNLKLRSQYEDEVQKALSLSLDIDACTYPFLNITQTTQLIENVENINREIDNIYQSAVSGGSQGVVQAAKALTGYINQQKQAIASISEQAEDTAMKRKLEQEMESLTPLVVSMISGAKQVLSNKADSNAKQRLKVAIDNGKSTNSRVFELLQRIPFFITSAPTLPGLTEISDLALNLKNKSPDPVEINDLIKSLEGTLSKQLIFAKTSGLTTTDEQKRLQFLNVARDLKDALVSLSSIQVPTGNSNSNIDWNTLDSCIRTVNGAGKLLIATSSPAVKLVASTSTTSTVSVSSAATITAGKAVSIKEQDLLHAAREVELATVKLEGLFMRSTVQTLPAQQAPKPKAPALSKQQPQTPVQTQVQPQLRKTPRSQPQPQTQEQIQFQLQSRNQANLQAQPQAQTQPQLRPQTQPQSQLQTQTQTQFQTQLHSPGLQKQPAQQQTQNQPQTTNWSRQPNQQPQPQVPTQVLSLHITPNLPPNLNPSVIEAAKMISTQLTLLAGATDVQSMINIARQIASGVNLMCGFASERSQACKDSILRNQLETASVSCKNYSVQLKILSAVKAGSDMKELEAAHSQLLSCATLLAKSVTHIIDYSRIALIRSR